jgi:hypothetical protein
MNELPDFKGKIVVLYLSNPSRPIQDGIVLEFPEFSQVDNRLFITGRIPEFGGDDWISRLQTGIAWDMVQSYLIFDSREDYLQRFSKGKSTIRSWLLRITGA